MDVFNTRQSNTVTNRSLFSVLQDCRYNVILLRAEGEFNIRIVLKQIFTHT